MPHDLHLFALSESRPFGERIAEELGCALGRHVERDFDDGEHKARPRENVRGRDVFVVQSLYGDEEHTVNDKLCRLLFFCGALRDADAARITAVVPYLCYARKDRKTQPRDPITTRYVARMFEAVGIDQVMTIDVHNLSAFQNAFHTARTDHLEARPLFVEQIAARAPGREVVVLSPDEGGVKRASRFAEGLQAALGRDVSTAFVEKLRAKGIVKGGTLVGDVEGRVVVVVDDLISTGTTIARAVAACAEAGAEAVYAVATHGLFVGDAAGNLAVPELDAVFVTNTVPPFRLAGSGAEHKVTTCNAAPLFAEAITAIHTGGSVTELLRVGDEDKDE